MTLNEAFATGFICNLEGLISLPCFLFHTAKTTYKWWKNNFITVWGSCRYRLTLQNVGLWDDN